MVIVDEALHTLTYSTCEAYLPEFTKAKCIKCYDGDTITLGVRIHERNLRFSCRLIGMDTPELRTKDPNEKQLAMIARDIIRGLLLHRIVDVTVHGTDKYGRLLVTIMSETHGNITEHMINSGLAVKYEGGRKQSVDWSIKLAEWRSR